MVLQGNCLVTCFPDGSKFLLVKDDGFFESGRNRPERTKPSEPDFVRSQKNSIRRTVETVFEIARSNSWEWFGTLTLNMDFCDRYDYASACSCLRSFTRAMRYRNCSWLIVPELHRDGAFHFHGLFNDPEQRLKMVFSGKYDKHGRPVYNSDVYAFGFTTFSQVGDQRRVSRYIAKYLTKNSIYDVLPTGKRRYWSSLDLLRPDKYIVDLSQADILRFSCECVYHRTIENDFGRFQFYELPASQ